MLNDLLLKEVESYGLLKITEKGKAYIQAPSPFEIPMNHNFEAGAAEMNGASDNGHTAVLDEALMNMLRDLRRSEARRRGVPPFVIFQENSLEDMATQYPVSMEDMAQIAGVSIGKARRYARPFIKLIQAYVEDNEIERPTEVVIKQVANKSKVKVNIIQAIDRQVPLEDIASANDLTLDDLVSELDAIVASGTKVNLDYYLEENVDEYVREDIFDYFMEAESDSVEEAYAELSEDDITLEEIRLMRLKFLSELGN